MEVIRFNKKPLFIAVALIFLALAIILASSKEDVKRIQDARTNDMVYQITGIIENGYIWQAIQGPETRQLKQGGTFLAATNADAKVGDYVTENGTIVDRYGNPL